MVFDLLDTEDLKKCSLLSRSLRSSVLPMVFYSVRAESTADWTDFLKFLETSPLVAMHIQELVLTGRGKRVSTSIDTLTTIAEYLPLLRSISLVSLDVYGSARAQSTFPDVQSLALIGVISGTLSCTIAEVISIFPHVKTLHIKHPGDSFLPAAKGSSHKPPLSLYELTLSYPSVKTLAFLRRSIISCSALYFDIHEDAISDLGLLIQRLGPSINVLEVDTPNGKLHPSQRKSCNYMWRRDSSHMPV